MSQDQIRRELALDFTKYAATCLKIRTKEGSVEPFKLNKAQLYLHQQLEEQKRVKGFVRAIILKGRQQGCSTYVGARFYHQATQRFGSKVFILTHREDATNNLYKLVQRYHENCPDFMKPSTGVSNAKELYFDTLDSGYAIGTAGGGTVGRSDTIQMLHGSEVAFWQNTDEIATGIMQTVADVKGTEIILESTANGIGNMYHRLAMDAMHGKNQYKLIFIPWYWQTEYTAEVPKDFLLTDDENRYKEAYKLTDGQMSWRRNKISNFTQGGEWQFRQEYPATAAEAFQSSSDDSLIQPRYVMDARAFKAQKGNQLVIGVDPAHKGSDRTAIVWRDGRVQYRHEVYQGLDTMQVVGRIIQIISHWNPEKVFIDMGGIGAGIYDRLKELNYSSICVGVNFGQRADEAERFINKRAEMWGNMASWFKDGGVTIEDNDEIHSDLIAPNFTFDSQGRLKLESKDEIKKRYTKSPDLGDALALTFAYKIPNKLNIQRHGNTRQMQVQSSWSVYD
jgi:hypothetical protein